MQESITLRSCILNKGRDHFYSRKIQYYLDVTSQIDFIESMYSESLCQQDIFSNYLTRTFLTPQGKQRAKKSQRHNKDAEPGKGWVKTFFYQLFSIYSTALVNKAASTGNEIDKGSTKETQNLSMHTCKWQLQSYFNFFFLSWWQVYWCNVP